MAPWYLFGQRNGWWDPLNAGGVAASGGGAAGVHGAEDGEVAADAAQDGGLADASREQLDAAAAATAAAASAAANAAANAASSQIVHFRRALVICLASILASKCIGPLHGWVKIAHDSIRDDQYLVGLELQNCKRRSSSAARASERSSA